VVLNSGHHYAAEHLHHAERLRDEHNATAPCAARVLATRCGFRWRQGSVSHVVECELPWPHDGAHMCADDLED
jgi:hypothetical protein